MKQTFFTLLFSIIFSAAFATQDMQYVVYFQEEYVQGMYNQGEKLEYPENAFLLPKMYNEMYLSDENIFRKILNKLSEKSPEAYRNVNWIKGDYRSDTIFFSANNIAAKYVDQIKNELTASVTANANAKYLALRLGGEYLYLNKDRITIPYFELAYPQEKISKTPTEIEPEVIADTIPDTSQVINEEKPVLKMYEPYLNLPLWISIALNIVLIIYIIIRSRASGE